MDQAEGRANAVASEALASIRMVAACGAESRIAAKYSQYVEETKAHGKLLSPLVGTQLALIVRSFVHDECLEADNASFSAYIRVSAFVSGMELNPSSKDGSIVSAIFLCKCLLVEAPSLADPLASCCPS